MVSKTRLLLTGLAILGASLLSVIGCTQTKEVLSLKVEPASVATGKNVTISGGGFTPGGRVVVFADAMVVGRGAVAVVMVEAQADSQGNINEEIAIPMPMSPAAPPKYMPAAYTVRATDDKVVSTGSFTVLPPPPQAAPPGAPGQPPR